MKKPSIPSVSIADPKIRAILGPMKEMIEVLGGVRGSPIKKLSFQKTIPEFLAHIDDADVNKDLKLYVVEMHNQTIEMAEKINQIIDRLSP